MATEESRQTFQEAAAFAQVRNNGGSDMGREGEK